MPAARLALAVLLLAIAARGAINFANTTPGGMDAGYYPIQARSLIETGSLMYRDVPLYHWSVAGLARALVALGWSLDSGVLAASKSLDTVLPIGLGLAIAALGIAFVRSAAAAAVPARGAAVAVAAPVALAVLAAPAMRTASDFQKQAAAMALLGAAVWLCRRALASNGVGRAAAMAWAGVGVLLALTGLTHAGTFAAAGLTLACVVGVHVAVFARVSPARLAGLALLAAIGAAALFAAVYIADTGKALGLVRGLSKLTRLSDATGDRPGPGGGFSPFGLAIAGVSHAVGLWTIVVARRTPNAPAAAPAADRSIGVGCAIAAMALASPLLAPDYFMRLTLMAPAPLAVALAFVLAQRARSGRRAWPAGVILAASAISAAIPLSFLLRPMVNEAGIAEMASMRTIVNEQPNTVVVARHGLEFWAAYFLHAPVRTGPGKAEDLAKFDRVLVLMDANGRFWMGGPGGPPRGRGPGQRGPGPGPAPMDSAPARLGPELFRGKEFILAERGQPEPRP